MPSVNLELEVVGLSYRVTTATMASLADDVPLAVKLEREPDNIADPNAVKVVVSEKPYAKAHGGFHIGYISRATASVIAPAMDDGSWPYSEIWLVDVDEETGRGNLIAKQKKKSAAK